MSGEISALSPEVRHYVLLWDSLFIQDGILCRTFAKKDGTGSYQQVLAPPSVREEILAQLHDSLMSGHLGEKKTRDKQLLESFLRNENHQQIKDKTTVTSNSGSRVTPEKKHVPKMPDIPIAQEPKEAKKQKA